MEEKERWKYGIGALLSLAAVLFLLIVVLNGSTIIVGVVLTIFQVVIAIASILICLMIAFVVIGKVNQTIANAKSEIIDQLESIREILNNLSRKLGADFIALISGVLTFFVQELIATYPLIYKICISIVVFVNFFLASQLIGSSRVTFKIVGIFLYIAPLGACSTAFLVLGGAAKLESWYQEVNIQQVLIISLTALSFICGLVFAFLKDRRIEA